MKNLKDLIDFVEEPEQKKRVEELVQVIRQEMLSLDSDYGIKTNLVALDVEMNQMLETFTDERTTIVPRLTSCLQKR